jgi:hypothetical protein
MKARISEEQLIEAASDLDLPQKLKIFFNILDELPTVYYEQIISKEFYDNIWPSGYYVVSDKSGTQKYFQRTADVVKYFTALKIYMTAKKVVAVRNTDKLVKKRYSLKYIEKTPRVIGGFSNKEVIMILRRMSVGNLLRYLKHS